MILVFLNVGRLVLESNIFTEKEVTLDISEKYISSSLGEIRFSTFLVKNGDS